MGGIWDLELWRIKDRHERDFCLGPTHEEAVTWIAREYITSYKQMPINLYQIQNKYRDESRPRFGLLRSREFVMKDAYSFDVDSEALDKTYNLMYEAYSNVFTRCGLNFAPVEADTGSIGGKGSHEFTAFTEVGESDIVYCEKCRMAATQEKAECVDDPPQDDVEMLPLEKKETPGTTTIEAVADYLGLDKKQTIKALLFKRLDAETLEVTGYVAAFVRGDRECNMIKMVNALDIPEHCLEFADEAEMGPATGCVAGFTGPMGLHDCTIVVDSELVGMKNLCAGACEKDHHLVNMNYGRDYKGDIVTDIKSLEQGDQCPVCGHPVTETKGIEVGQIFKLRDKYSVAMGANFVDENMKSHPIQMGCYGIGVSRTMAAVVEQHYDDKGIVWPVSVAPYHVIITLIKAKDETQAALAEKIYDELQAAGVEVVLDDRDERPGVKFKDADLIGYPIRITVGKRAGEDIVEYKLRREENVDEITSGEAVTRAIEPVKEEGDGRCFFR